MLKKEELMHLTEHSVRAWLPLSLHTQCRPAAPVVAPTADCTQKMGVRRLGDTQEILCKHPSLWLTKATSEDGHKAKGLTAAALFVRAAPEPQGPVLRHIPTLEQQEARKRMKPRCSKRRKTDL